MWIQAESIYTACNRARVELEELEHYVKNNCLPSPKNDSPSMEKLRELETVAIKAAQFHYEAQISQLHMQLTSTNEMLNRREKQLTDLRQKIVQLERRNLLQRIWGRR